MRLSWNLCMCRGALPGLKNGSLAKEVGDRKFPTPLPSQKRLLMLLEERCLPCRRLPDANKIKPQLCPQTV